MTNTCKWHQRLKSLCSINISHRLLIKYWQYSMINQLITCTLYSLIICLLLVDYIDVIGWSYLDYYRLHSLLWATAFNGGRKIHLRLRSCGSKQRFGSPFDFLFQIHALITGPFDTPYEGGFYYFLIRCPPDYPIRPPRVKLMTTGGGQVRFNPNLYRNGKVCLSILGWVT